MQRDSWYTVARHFEMLDDAAAVGRKAAARTVRRLGARRISTRKAPVVFEAPVAGSLLSHLAGAVSGSSIYRGLSFLRNRLDEQIAAPGISVIDDSRLPGRIGSRPFDAEGKRRVETPSSKTACSGSSFSTAIPQGDSGGNPRPVQSAASETRRRPGPRTSTSKRPHGAGEILAGLSAALLVTSLSGLGVNPVTGDYSRGASGIWIERGRAGPCRRGDHHREQSPQHVSRHRSCRERPRVPEPNRFAHAPGRKNDDRRRGVVSPEIRASDPSGRHRDRRTTG